MPLRVFPVEASAHPSFASAFNASHRGIDIFAANGSGILASDSGSVRAADDPKGGRVLYLAADDGVTYYYAHLSDYNGTFPRRVAAGDLIGSVGTTGNAVGTSPHLHFEVHPNGTKDAVDPYPQLVALKEPASIGDLGSAVASGATEGISSGASSAVEITRKSILVVTLVALPIALGAAYALKIGIFRKRNRH